MQSRAHQLYHQIVSAENPKQVLREMVDSHKTETEFLEFKGAGKIQDRQIKEFWSTALSGFANTEGGVLIWGIRATRVESLDETSRKIDAASEFDLVPNQTAFRQLLADVLLEACVESPQGVEIACVNTHEDDGAGFVVCLIPEGEHKPYRAELGPSKQYYQRIGDNFVIIPHSLLRSLFYPHLAPLLYVQAWPTNQYQYSEKPSETIVFFARLQNRGTASAKEIFITWKTLQETAFSWGSAWEPRKDFGGKLYGVCCGHTLHPDETVEMGAIEVPSSDRLGERGIIKGGFDMTFTVYAADQPPQRIPIRFEEREIAFTKPDKDFGPELKIDA